MTSSKPLSNKARIKHVIATVTNLASPDPSIQMQAVAELDQLPEGYFEDLGVPQRALRTIQHSLPTVITQTKQPRVLEWIALFFAESHPIKPETLSAFAPFLTHSDERLLIAVIFLLGSGRQLSDSHLPEILRHAHHKDDGVRWRVVWAYSHIAHGASEEHLSYFRKWIHDSHATARLYASLCLSRTPLTIPGLRELLVTLSNDPDSNVAHYAIKALEAT